MTPKKFLIFLGIAALIHVVAVLALAEIILLLTLLSPPPSVSRIPAESPTTVTIMPTLVPQTERDRRFIDTDGLLSANKPDPNALFEGAANTRAASQVAGTGSSMVPNQTGTQKEDLELRESPYSAGHEGYAQPRPATEQEKPTPQTPDKPPVTPTQTPKKPTPSTDELFLKPGNEFSQTPRSEEPAQPQKTQNSPPNQKSSPESAPRPPPSVFSMDRRRTSISGGAPVGEDSSVATQESELGRYKLKLYRAVGSRWYLYVQSQLSTLNVSKVRIRFFIRANGVIERAEVVDGGSQSLLAAISKKSITDIGALEPFSDQMKQQLGDGYWEEISFSIY